jgi:hypothetical protein
MLNFGTKENLKTIEIVVKNTPLLTTKAYDYYWSFAKKRQDIFYSRINGQLYPWTDDRILNTYKFTNTYRASDRVSQYLIKNVIYSGCSSTKEVFFRIILFKLFNKIETWELLCSHVGEISTKNYSFKLFDKILTEAMDNGERIYSAAYIMPSRGIPSVHRKKHRMHLELIEKMLTDNLPERVSSSKSLKEVYELLLSYPGIGKFLAFQYAIDLNYSEIIDFSEMDFVVAGPGAKNGISKCFQSLNGLSDEYIIQYMADSQDNEFERLGLYFKTLWGRKLQLIDCQNLFCELDKYTRVKLPELSEKTGRTRIKQKFAMNRAPIKYWYPPKWGLNNFIK